MAVISAAANPARRMAAIVILLLAGVLAGAQLGKIAPLVPWYEVEIGLSLVAIGWLTALLGLFVGVAALPAGVWIGRKPAWMTIAIGSAFLVAGGLWFAFAADVVAIFAARLVEAVGYLILCIALPAALARVSPAPWQAPVLAIWSGFVPLGFATADLSASLLLPLISPSDFLALLALGYGVLALAGVAIVRGLEAPPPAAGSFGIRAAASAPVMLLAGAFAAFVVVSVALFAFLPSFAASGDRLVMSAGAIALSVPVGNFLAGVLVRGRSGRAMVAMATGSFMLCALGALGAFFAGGAVVATLSALLLAVASGLVASMIFAATPLAAQTGVSIGAALGLVSQAGGIATVLGPPAGAAVIERFSWVGFGVFLSVICLTGAACLVPLLRSRKGSPSAARRS